VLERIGWPIAYGGGIGLLLTGLVIFTVSILVTRYLHKLNLQKSLNAPESTSNATCQEPTGDTPTREDLPSGKENNPYQNLPEELVEQLIREQRNIVGSLQALEGRYASLEQLDGYLPVLKELEIHLPELQEAVHFLKIATISGRRDPTMTDLSAGRMKTPSGDIFEISSWYAPIGGHLRIGKEQSHDIKGEFQKFSFS
jgi:hypothetical protein